MDFNQFYQLSNKDTKGMLYASSGKDIDSYKLFRGELELDAPVKFFPNIGKKVYDVVGSGYALFDLFSSKITNTLAECKITGWKTYPCELYGWDGKKIEGYSIFSVTGRCGPIDWSKSEKFVKDPYVPGGRAAPMQKGVYFGLDTWDGSDIFTAEGGTAYTFVNQKVRDLLFKNKITNILLKRVTEVEILDLPKEISPDRLKKIHRIFGAD
jgi:hypothetical protein